MTVIENFALRFVSHVSVDRRCDDRTVAEKGLNETEIDPLFEKHRRNRVPEDVRCDFFDSRCLRVSLQGHSDRLLGKSPSESIGEKEFTWVSLYRLNPEVCDEG